MIVEETFSVAAPKDDVVAYFLDVPRMTSCVPGVDGLRQVDDSTFEADLALRIGPIQARFAGTVVIDRSEAPDRIVATASGRDAKTGSVAQIHFSADIVEVRDDTTEVRSTSDVAIRGRLGQFGSGVITGTAHEMIRAFAACAEATLGTSTDGVPAPPETPRLASVAGRGLVTYLRYLWAELLDLIRGRRKEENRR